MTARKIIRRMGYLRDQQGIVSRYQGEGGNWDRHLQKCRDFIRGAFRAGDYHTVAILGSGWLLDVPLEHLEEQFEKIWLVDIAHPPQVKKKVERSERVELVECDLSGGVVEQAWTYTRQQRRPALKEFTASLELRHPLSLQPDALISLNLLNQLDILVCDYLIKFMEPGEGELMELRRRIQSFHLDWIRKVPGLLISDTVEISRDRKGNESRTPLIHVRLPGGIREEQWQWDFDTRGTYRPGRMTHMEVKALEWA